MNIQVDCLIGSSSRSIYDRIADTVYDSDPLRERLLDQNILLIAPHRRRRTKAAFNDGRWLRRYRKRWKVERTFAWLSKFRRLAKDYEFRTENSEAMILIAATRLMLAKLA